MAELCAAFVALATIAVPVVVVLGVVLKDLLSSTKECPYCKEEIRKDCTVCPVCRRNI